MSGGGSLYNVPFLRFNYNTVCITEFLKFRLFQVSPILEFSSLEEALILFKNTD